MRMDFSFNSHFLFLITNRMKMSDGMDFPFLFPIPLFLTRPYGFSLLGFVLE